MDNQIKRYDPFHRTASVDFSFFPLFFAKQNGAINLSARTGTPIARRRASVIEYSDMRRPISPRFLNPINLVEPVLHAKKLFNRAKRLEHAISHVYLNRKIHHRRFARVKILIRAFICLSDIMHLHS